MALAWKAARRPPFRGADCAATFASGHCHLGVLLMPRSASSPQYLETRRLSKAQLFAMRAAHEEGLGWDTRRPSDHNYLFVPGRLLVDTEDAGLDQVIDVFNRRKSDFRIASAPELDDARTPKIDSLDSYRFVSRERRPDESEAAYERARRRDLVNAVRIYDDELGPGVVTPEHYVHVAGSGNGRACPATEPAETVLAQAWPEAETDKSVGDGVSVVVIDTGWPQPAVAAAASEELARVTTRTFRPSSRTQAMACSRRRSCEAGRRAPTSRTWSSPSTVAERSTR